MTTSKSQDKHNWLKKHPKVSQIQDSRTWLGKHLTLNQSKKRLNGLHPG